MIFGILFVESSRIVGTFLIQMFVSAIIMFLITIAVTHWRHSWRLRDTPAQTRTAFTTAVLQNDVAFVRAALESGMDADTRLLDTQEFDKTDRLISRLSFERSLLAPTALIVSASLGYIEMADTLLEFGADLSRKNGLNTLGSNALHAAASAGHREMMELFIRRSGLDSLRGSEFETTLISAAYGGHNAVIALLLENGADVNLANSDGETPLMAVVDISRLAVVDSDRLQAVNVLITAGAELHARDNDGRTALWWAKNSQLHALLKAAGAAR